LVPPDHAEESRAVTERVRRGERVNPLETVRRRKDGTPVEVAVTVSAIRDGQGQLVGASSIARDITPRKRMERALQQSEERFRQAQKMESIGRLAGGVAHNFNNLLTVINGYSELLLRRPGLEVRTRDLLLEMTKAGEQAARLTGQLLAFGRQAILQPRVLDLNAVMGNLEKMLRRLVGEDVELTMLPGAGLRLVRADPGQIEQVLINLAVNARDAMPRGGRVALVQEGVARLDGQRAAPGHRVPGVHRQVDAHLLDLAGVGPDQPQARARKHG